MDVRPLTPLLGAEISGIDLRNELSPAEADAILAAFKKHHVLVFHDQDLTREQQDRFAAHFGPQIFTHQSVEEGLAFISNRVEGGAVGDGVLAFHADHSFYDVPDTDVLALFAIKIPSSGGETHFAHAGKAYDDLPADVKRRIVGLHAVHRYAGKFRAVHPLARWLPEIDQNVLFVNQFCAEDGIPELDAREGGALLDLLCSYLYRDELLYKHAWRVGDFVIWNNRLLQHARTAFNPSEERTLRRSTLGVPEAVIEAKPREVGV